MCGRFTLILLHDLNRIFPWISPPPEDPPRYNIAPSQPILIATNEAPGGQFKFERALWGLIPSWAKDPSIGNRMINARAETLAQKPAFRTALSRRRCLIPADGFYEWRKESDGSKTPMYIHLKSGEPFAFAGLWETWHDPAAGGSEVRSCTVITAEPNELVAPIHNRMPVIVPASKQQFWLSPSAMKPEEFAGMFEPYPAGEMEAFPVSKAVNNPRNEDPICAKPVLSPPPALFL